MVKKYTAIEARHMILDVSSRLFTEKGYEKTSIQDIVRGLDGLTRGAVYHHFDSKEAIIESVARRCLPEECYLTAIDERTDLTGLEKIQELLIESMFNQEVGQAMDLAYPLMNDPKFYAIYITQLTDVLAPKVEAYIIEGNKSGHLSVALPKQLSEIIILLLSTWFIPALYPNTAETFFDKLKACQFVLAQSGVDVLSHEVMERITKKITEKVIEFEENT